MRLLGRPFRLHRRLYRGWRALRDHMGRGSGHRSCGRRRPHRIGGRHITGLRTTHGRRSCRRIRSNRAAPHTARIAGRVLPLCTPPGPLPGSFASRKALAAPLTPMTGFLLNTNVVSELMKPGPNRRVETWVEQTSEELLHPSVITIGELRKGIDLLASDDPQRAALQSWLDRDLRLGFAGRLLVFDDFVAQGWGQLAGSDGEEAAFHTAYDRCTAGGGCTPSQSDVRHSERRRPRTNGSASLQSVDPLRRTQVGQKMSPDALRMSRGGKSPRASGSIKADRGISVGEPASRTIPPILNAFTGLFRSAVRAARATVWIASGQVWCTEPHRRTTGAFEVHSCSMRSSATR